MVDEIISFTTHIFAKVNAGVEAGMRTGDRRRTANRTVGTCYSNQDRQRRGDSRSLPPSVSFSTVSHALGASGFRGTRFKHR